MIDAESLKKLGFMKAMNFGKNSGKSELNWPGAPLWWDGQNLRYQNQVLNLSTIEQVSDYIKSLKIPRGRGRKTTADAIA